MPGGHANCAHCHTYAIHSTDSDQHPKLKSFRYSESPRPVCHQLGKEITRSKHSRLCILNIHIVHTRQITHTTGYNDKTFILDCPCLSTNTYTGITVLSIGEEWNKQNLHSLIGHDTRKLGKFHIITNQDTNLVQSVSKVCTILPPERPQPLSHREYVPFHTFRMNRHAVLKTNIIKPSVPFTYGILPVMILIL